jgi:hypothetical protein
LEDILIFNEQINLELFEKVILLYIHESIMQNKIVREMEGVLEYIHFLIIYKLKIFLNSEKTDSKENEYLFNVFRSNYRSNYRSNPNFINSDDNFNGNLYSQADNKNYFSYKNRNNSIEDIKNTMQRIKSFFSHFELLKKKFIFETNPDYIKNFLEIINEKRIDDLDLSEIPYSVLIMQCNYLKGKLANISGHLNKALEHFYKSREYLTICDAWIIKKSNKNIKKIYVIINQKIEGDIYRIENASNEADLKNLEEIYFGNLNNGNIDSKKSSPEISNKNTQWNQKNSNFKLQFNSNFNNTNYIISNNNITNYNKSYENVKLFNPNLNSDHNKKEISNLKNIKKHFFKNHNLQNSHKNNNSNNLIEFNLNNNKDQNNNLDSQSHTSNNPNLKPLTILQKIEKKKTMFLKYKNDIADKIALLDKEINTFLDYNKDLLIVIDISAINEVDIKKYENLVKLSSGFYENYVCLGDRFGIFLGYDSILPLIPFDKKQINNYQFTKSNLNAAVKNLGNYSFVNTLNPLKGKNQNMKICKSILHVFEYLNKKWNFENEKWLILFLTHFDLDYENKKKIENESLIKKYLNLIIIGIDFDQDSINKAKDFLKLFGDKSHYFADDNVGGLKSVFRKKVFDKNKHFFPFEIYKTGKINNNFNNFKK